MDLKRGLAELGECYPEYAQAEKYYKGSVAELFTSARLRRLMSAAGIDVRFNFAKTPVNAMSDRLEINATVGPDDAATAVIQRIWTDNDLDLEAPGIMRNACKFGDAYVIVWPREDEAGDTVGVDIHYSSPQTTRIIYDTERPNVPSFAIKRWCEVDDEGVELHRVDLYYPNRIEKYISDVGTKGEEAKDYLEYRDEEDDAWPYENPFGQIPVFHFRTDRPYGVPLHEGFYGPQDAINKLIISHLSSVDFSALPFRYALTEANKDASDAIGDDDTGLDFGDPNAPVGVDDEQPAFRAEPGMIQVFQNIKAMGQFDSAQPAVFTDPMAVYLRAGAQITNTPLHYFDPTGDQPSGESLRTAEAPFIKMVRYLQMSFGATWRQVFEFALALLGVNNEGVSVNWAPPQSASDQEFWDVAEKKIAAGVPPRQILHEAGYTADQIDAWIPSTDQATA
jgi:hypothetical protein